MTQLRAGVGLARQTIDLYLAMAHEEANPVPVDDLVRGRVALSIRRHEPVGVVAPITPYNGALIMAFQKLIPALMAGNSVILRPSPLTPLSSLVFGAAAEAAGLPAGVLSVVIEYGAAGAELLTIDPAVDMVSFTGSTAVGRQILAQAAPTVKRVSLELGGKSAQIYLDDAVDRAALGAGRGRHEPPARPASPRPACWCPNDARRGARGGLRHRTATIRSAIRRSSRCCMGPVISAAQRERCERLRRSSPRNTAARWSAAAGGRPGSIVATTSSRPSSTCRTTRTRGARRDLRSRHRHPRLRGPRRRRAIANDSIYGLSGQVYGADVAAATAVARRLRTGAVNVNTSVFSAYAPGGGYKQSGLGRERGPEGIREFQEVKHMTIGELA